MLVIELMGTMVRAGLLENLTIFHDIGDQLKVTNAQIFVLEISLKFGVFKCIDRLYNRNYYSKIVEMIIS